MNEVSFAESIDRLKESFLWAAAQGGNTQDCQALLEIGADIDWKHANGDTALLAACRRGHSETVAMLLAHGANSNLCGTDSMAPIHVSASRGDADTLDKLLEANASTAMKNKEGLTALDIAKARGHESIYARLMRTRRSVPARVPSSSRVLDAPTVISSVTPLRESLPSMSPVLAFSANDPPPRPVLESLPVSLDRSGSAANRKKPTNDRRAALDDERRVAGRSYSIMGDSSAVGAGGGAGLSGGSLEETIALKKLLDSEIAKRKAFETKLEVFAGQNKQLLEELTNVTQQLQTAEEKADGLEGQLSRLRAEDACVKAYAIDDLERLEAELKASLVRVEQRKAVLVRSQIEAQKEQRLCVICCEKEKSVVLLPCRHLCLCDGCSRHGGLDMCPLCREAIVHKISVFS